MMKWVVAAGAGFLLGWATTTLLPAPSGQAVTLGALPQPYYRVLWENDEIRVVEHLLEPGDREPMHSHPRMIGTSWRLPRSGSGSPTAPP
jgi:hypothetical protein